MLAERLAQAFRNDALDLCILPTEQCNFRCVYCYEDFAIGKMPSHVIHGIKNLIARRADDLSFLSISWFGGEPMLAVDVMRDVSLHVRDIVERTAGLTYKASITTNGSLLTEERLCELESFQIREYQISLDGPRHLHNRTRLRANNSGTFDQIWQNLLAIKNSDFDIKIILRVHVTKSILDEMPGFLAQLRDQFLDDNRFSVFIKPVEKMGGKNDDDLNVLGADKPNIVKRLKSIVSKDGELRESLFSEPTVCYACSPNFFMIRADGRIGKCTVAMSDQRNTIGRINSDGTIGISQESARAWLLGWKTMDKHTLQCPYGAMRAEENYAPLS